MKRESLGAPVRQLFRSTLASLLMAGGSGCDPCDLSGAGATDSCSSEAAASSGDACPEPEPEALATLGRSISIPGSVRSGCGASELTFSVDENATLNLSLERATASLTLTLARLEPVVEIQKVYAGPASDAFAKLAVSAGQYRIKVETSSSQATYQIGLDRVPRSAPSPLDPGEEPAVALDLGELGTVVKTSEEYVGTTDAEDFYRFQLSENAVVTYTLQTDSFDARAQLFEDAEQLDEANGALLSLTAYPEPQTERLNLESGVYFFRVAARASSINYTLKLSAEPYASLGDTPDSGEDAEDAREVDTLGLSLVKAGGYVGPTDRADYYRFTLSRPAALTFSVKSLVNSGRVRARFIADAVQLNPNDPLYQFTTDGIGDYTDCRGFESGDYYLQITPYSGEAGALYTLLLSSSDSC
jgi:hypothetical protein